MPQDGFPTTRRSAIARLACDEPPERERALAALVAAYWKPVYKHVRLGWRKSREDAEDLTQGFFVRLLEKDFLAAYDPLKGRFRTFVRACLDGYLANEQRSEERLKRGGGLTLLSLEFERAEGELARLDPPAPEQIERTFEQEFARSLFGLALDALATACREQQREAAFRAFVRYDVEEPPPGEGRPTYEALAAELGVPPTTVTNLLALARREFRRLLLDKLREITATDEEYRMEARQLLGIDP